MSRLCVTMGVSLALVWNIGCSGPAQPGLSPAANVKGTVNMDGKPIPNGEIVFSITGAPPRLMYINNGNFAGEAPVGNNVVEVMINVDGPKNPKYAGDPPKINSVPQKYWGPKSVLKATVTAGAANDFKFDITSK